MSVNKLAYARLSIRVNVSIVLVLLLVVSQTLGMPEVVHNRTDVAPWGMDGMGMVDNYNPYDTIEFHAAINSTIESYTHQRRQL